ncbi:DUF771 domain-containing protein [Staphylococcus shinii]|uniref:DUF771 domain-containing protein n=1 Tax=Staphylococcus shinii TaxID=2912228 RepID=UPI000C326C57|nr:DUF771 domain-containing protein [Staphylococcus shinii]PKI11037.1 DUF771 domain-containing protein [Staphylococcus shinii]
MTQLTVTIPEQYVVITREEYQQLQEKEKPVWWSMQDLINETGFKRNWLVENILYNPKYIKQLKQFVYYPDGGKWAFNREPMRCFLKDNFEDIFN